MKGLETYLLESRNVKIKGGNGDIVVSAVYSLPRHSIKQNKFEEFSRKLENKFIPGRDYNSIHSSWGSRLTSPGDDIYAKLFSIIIMIQLLHSAKQPEQVSGRSRLLQVKNILLHYIDISNYHDLSSDHSATICTVSTLKSLQYLEQQLYELGHL